MELKIKIKKTYRKELYNFIARKLKEGYRFQSQNDTYWFKNNICTNKNNNFITGYTTYPINDGDIFIGIFLWESSSNLFKVCTYVLKEQLFDFEEEE